jgi:hypothetical protein
MSANDRIKRPPLERLQAIRNWSTLFNGAVTAGDGVGPDSGASEPAPLNEVIARSVDLGYRVVDEYVRQGQKAAQRLNERSYGAQTMAGDVQDLAMRLTQYASDFAGVWLQLVQLAAAGNGAPAAPKTAEQAGPLGTEGRAADAADAPTAGQSAGGQTPAAEATHVRIAVRSAQPVEVTVDIRPEAARRALIVHALRSVDPDAPRLDDVRFEPGSDEVAACLRVHVPAGHAPGIYSGLMIDEHTSRPVGTVSVTIAG